MSVTNILILSENEKYSSNVLKCVYKNPNFNFFLSGNKSTHKKIKNCSLFSKFIPLNSSFLKELNPKDELFYEILETIKSFKIDIISPSDFESLKFLSLFKEELKKYTSIVPLSNLSLIELLDKKSSCINFLKNKDILIPKTVNIKNIEELKINTSSFSFPFLIKSDFGAGGSGNIKINNELELDLYLKEKKEVKNLFIQDYISGVDYCFSSYCINGDIKAWTIFRYIEFDKNQSKGVFAEFLEDKEIYDCSKRIISISNYTGPIVIDFRKEKDTNKIFFIEINPRFGNNTVYSTSDGINFLEVGINLSKDPSFKANPMCKALLSCNLKRLLTAPIRKLDFYAFYYIYKTLYFKVLKKFN